MQVACKGYRLMQPLKGLRRLMVELGRRIDALWGYDVFIAHRRADAADYAQALHVRLTAERISSFIDRVIYLPGDPLLVATRRHVAKSTLLVLLGSPQLLVIRRPTDWVSHEIDTYLQTHGERAKLLVVDFGGTVATAMPGTETPAFLPNLAQFLRIDQEAESLVAAPADAVLSAIRANLGSRRRERARLWLFEGIAAMLFVLLLVSVVLGVQREQERRFAEGRRLVAEARLNLSLPNATQTAIAQARAALRLAPGVETRSLALELLQRLPSPTMVLRGADKDGGALFAAALIDGRMVYETIRDGTRVLLRDAVGASSAAFGPGAECVDRSYAQAGTRIACRNGNRLQVWQVDRGIKLFDRMLPSAENAAPVYALSPGGEMVVAAGTGQLIVSRIDTGSEVLANLPGDGWPPQRLTVSDDGHYVGVVPSSVDITDGTPCFLVDMQIGSARVVVRQSAGITAVRFFQNSHRLVVVTDDGLASFHTATPDVPALRFNVVPRPFAIATSVDGRFLAVGGDNVVAVYAARTGSELVRASPEGRVYSVEFDANGTSLVTAGTNAENNTSNIVVWSLLAADRFMAANALPSSGIGTIGFDSNGRLLVTSFGVISTNDLGSGKKVSRNLAAFAVEAVTPSSSGSGALLAGYDVPSFREGVTDTDGRKVGPLREASIAAPTANGDAIAFLQMPPPLSEELAHVSLWRKGHLDVLSRDLPGTANSLGIDATGSRILVTIASRSNSRASFALLSGFDLRTIAEWQSDAVDVFATISPDGRSVLVGENQTLSLLSLPGLRLLAKLNTTGKVMAVSIAPNKSVFAAVDDSSTVSVFSKEGQLFLVSRTEFQKGLSFSPDGRRLALLADTSGGGVAWLMPTAGDFDAMLCSRLLHNPNHRTWVGLLPNDSEPQPCTLASTQSVR